MRKRQTSVRGKERRLEWNGKGHPRKTVGEWRRIGIVILWELSIPHTSVRLVTSVMKRYTLLIATVETGATLKVFLHRG